MEILYVLSLIVAGLAAILAWTAKLRWSKEYADAMRETIAAKEATIEALGTQLAVERDLNPVKIREYFTAVRVQLEEYNEQLQAKLEEAQREIEGKTSTIQRLELAGRASQQEMRLLLDEKEKLQSSARLLEEELKSMKAMGSAAEPLLNESSTALNAVFTLGEHFAVGEFVKVITGPFEGVTGQVVERRGAQRVLVGLDTIGQGLEIDIDSRNLRLAIDGPTQDGDD